MTTTINRSTYPIQTSMKLIGKMQEQFATLQTQLATGKSATNLAEYGSDRGFDLTLRSRLNRIDGYKTNTQNVTARLDVLDTAISSLDTLESTASTAVTPSAYGTGNINFATAPSLAASRLDTALSVLNTDVGGRYVFGGSSTETAPVAAMDAILNGAGGKAGFKQVAAERQAADVGDGLGRLTLSSATDTVSLAEDGSHPFGFKLSTLTASSSAVTLTQPTGTPPSLSVKFDTVPLAGDSVSLGFTMPDGTEEGVTLKAVTGTPGAGEFQIGADAATTAANFQSALQTSLQSDASTKLVVASNYAAASNFFNGQGQAVQRVTGPDFAHATALADADPTTTVSWYTGADAANARSSVSSKIGETSTVNYGVQANESGTVTLVRNLAVLAIQNFTTADTTSGGRFDAVASRAATNLSSSHDNEQGSIEMIAVELGNASAAVKSVGDRNSAYSAQLTGMLDDIEGTSDTEVSAKILALQTRLQATFQTTSTIAQLSLVNYLK